PLWPAPMMTTSYLCTASDHSFPAIPATVHPRLMPARLIPSRHLRIGRSRAGLGLFARVVIKKGQFIVRYSRRKIRPAAAEDLDTRYLFEINERWTIDGAHRTNRARYINHSCRPNAEVYFVKHVVKVRAIKTIKAGDEIPTTMAATTS